MKADQVRGAFLDYFAAREHERVHSSSLVPANDPTLMFTNAGMVQFKDVFTGRENRAIKRATTAQKCVRAGGKHNDLDEVGKTARHHTFFEMLGNFSFGDYFKPDAIRWAWELLTDVYKLDPKRMVFTVFAGDKSLGVSGDDEARGLWQDVAGIGEDRVLGLGASENFWMMGETGPMGPCSEIHYWTGPQPPTALPTSTSPAAAWNGWVEIWNLVFMQYERREAGGPLFPLPAPSIDTGAGLERVTAALQGKQSNYDTDLFMPLIEQVADIAGVRYGAGSDSDTSMRVIADHARASAFLIADGVFPDKTGREYVLRRIFRRAVRHGHLLGIKEPFMPRICEAVIDMMRGAYPELAERQAVIREITLEEEKRFRLTLERGLELLDTEFAALRVRDDKIVPGDKVFQLYDTFGFPHDLTEIIAGEQGFAIDREGYEAALEVARDRSRFTGADAERIDDLYKQLAGEHGATHFVGYEGVTGEGMVTAIVRGGQSVNAAGVGDEIQVVANKTPFYGEAGGQTGDSGTARSSAGGMLAITNTIKPTGDMIVHIGKVTEGEIVVGQLLTFEVDDARREQIRANHSATHLLHLALKQVLGPHVAQKGSLVAPDRLRFDFSHFSPMTEDQKRAVEDKVNTEIWHNDEAVVEVLPVSEARQRGAVAMFGEKYGETVRVMKIGRESLEFCGGTHVRRTGDIGVMKIVSESGIAQGVRRIEAVTGAGALAYLRSIEDELARAGSQLKAGPMEVAARVGKLQGEARRLERELASVKAKLASGGARDLLSEVADIAGIKMLAIQTDGNDAKALRETGDTLRDRIGSGIIVLAGVDGDQVALLAMVTKDLTNRFHAGKLLQSMAEVLGGRGGGRPDMAQGGGTDPTKVPEALARAVEMVKQQAAS